MSSHISNHSHRFIDLFFSIRSEISIFLLIQILLLAVHLSLIMSELYISLANSSFAAVSKLELRILKLS